MRCKPRTAKNYRAAIRSHILPALGKKALRDVGPKDVAALHHKQLDTPAAGDQAVWVLSKMFKLAESWGMVAPGRRPTRHVRRYGGTSRERFLTPEEYRRLGAALKRLEASGALMPSAAAAIRLLMLTGCRKSEIRTLRWSDIHLGESKTGPRAVQLPPAAARLLEALPQRTDSPWVFPGNDRDGRYSGGGLDHAWRTVRAAAGLEDVRLHDLRQSCAAYPTNAP